MGGSSVRRFEPKRFEAETKMRLFKLHGSINWFMFANEAETDVFCGIPINGDPNSCRDQNGQQLENVFAGSVFLAGTYNKVFQYGFGIIAEMHFWFHKRLKEHDTIAMCGYGWNDFGVNVRLSDWLRPQASSRLCLMHEKPEEIVQRRGNPIGENYYRWLVEQGRVILIKKWMEHVRIQELLDSLRD